MMKKIMIALLLAGSFSACDVLQEVAGEAGKTLSPPTESEIVQGLKEALKVGTGDAVSFLNKEGGYLNTKFKIPFPPEVQKVADKARQLGLGSQVDEFVTRMNRGAEDAAAEAKPIFVNAITSMTLTDGKNILFGQSNAATMYFKGKTTDGLYNAFSPKIKASLDKFQATKYWSDLTTTYNRIPGVQKVETDLVKYTTNKALDGLFIKLAEEEAEIRNNVAARVSPILVKVFGYADSQR